MAIDPTISYYTFDGVLDMLELPWAGGGPASDFICTGAMSGAAFVKLADSPVDQNDERVIFRQGTFGRGRVAPEVNNGWFAFTYGPAGSERIAFRFGYKAGAFSSGNIRSITYSPIIKYPKNELALVGFSISAWATRQVDLYVIDPVNGTLTDGGAAGLVCTDASNTQSVEIAGTHVDDNNYLKGDVYWVSLQHGVVYTQNDFEDLYNGIKHPVDDFNPMFYINFCQDVGIVYQADVGIGPNAPYLFDVLGDPVKGGGNCFPSGPVTWIAEILIGDIVVYSCRNSLPQRNIAINVANYYGQRRLKFRIRRLS